MRTWKRELCPIPARSRKKACLGKVRLRSLRIWSSRGEVPPSDRMRWYAPEGDRSERGERSGAVLGLSLAAELSEEAVAAGEAAVAAPRSSRSMLMRKCCAIMLARHAGSPDPLSCCHTKPRYCAGMPRLISRRTCSGCDCA